MTADDAGRPIRWANRDSPSVGRRRHGIDRGPRPRRWSPRSQWPVGRHLRGATNVYAAAAIAQALGLWPRAGLGGLVWANRQLAVVSTVLVAAPIGVLITGPARPVAIGALAGPIAVLLIRGYLADRKRTEWQR